MNGRNTDGTFTSGNAGRPKGARNKSTMAVLELLEERGLNEVVVRCIGIPDEFVEHGDRQRRRGRPEEISLGGSPRRGQGLLGVQATPD